jgi:serine/threonine protein kinase
MKAAHPDGFEEPIIAIFLKETLKALEYLHNQGHIHRDVKVCFLFLTFQFVAIVAACFTFTALI